MTAYDTQPERRTAKNTDKARLSRNRRRDVVQNDEYAKFVRRIVRAYARRVASGDVEALADMARLARDLDEAIGDAAIGLHRFGYSWTEIGNRLGITRQAVGVPTDRSPNLPGHQQQSSRCAGR